MFALLYLLYVIQSAIFFNFHMVLKWNTADNAFGFMSLKHGGWLAQSGAAIINNSLQSTFCWKTSGKKWLPEKRPSTSCLWYNTSWAGNPVLMLQWYLGSQTIGFTDYLTLKRSFRNLRPDLKWCPRPCKQPHFGCWVKFKFKWVCLTSIYFLR